MKSNPLVLPPSATPAGRPARTGWLLGLVFGLLAAVSGCEGWSREVVFSGKTMGTTYHIKVVAGYFQRTAHLGQAVEARLAQVNQSMSTYLKDSEISRFNAHRQTDTPFAASADFYVVMEQGRRLHELSQGAWDGTVDPLVNLWGFGRSGWSGKIPDQDQIDQARAKVGFGHFTFGTDRRIGKDRPDVSVDLGSIAKGFGVDAIAGVLRRAGFSRFIVEIGGEVYAAGLRRDGTAWRVGINRPEKGAALDSVYQTLALSDQALATSGDYRQFFEHNGRRYSHIIDPATGRPVDNRVVGVSIVADTCALADGLATAVVVMGVERGMELIRRLEGVDGLIVEESAQGSLVNHFSPGFSALIR